MAQQQRQQHHQAEEVAQDLGLERVEMQRQRTHQAVENLEHEAGRAGPEQALQRRVEVPRAVADPHRAAAPRARLGGGGRPVNGHSMGPSKECIGSLSCHCPRNALCHSWRAAWKCFIPFTAAQQASNSPASQPKRPPGSACRPGAGPSSVPGAAGRWRRRPRSSPSAEPLPGCRRTARRGCGSCALPASAPVAFDEPAALEKCLRRDCLGVTRSSSARRSAGRTAK